MAAEVKVVKVPIRWADALQQLLMQHTPFQPSDTEDFKELTRQFSALEQLFLEKTGLRSYYAGCMGIVCEDATPPDPCETVHVASMQIQLMEDAFFSLRLYHYANAPDNRGWMNLFRSWGRYDLFRRHFKELEPHFSRRFVSFYYSYIETWDAIDQEPVPHAWDVSGGIPEIEQPPEEDLLPEELERRRQAGRRTAVEATLVNYRGVTAAGVARAKAVSTPTHTVKGLHLDRGRREAGTPYGKPPGRHRDAPAGTSGEHSETPTPPSGEPA
jgi:hypothetical protein